MSTAMLTKMHINGYDVLSVNSGRGGSVPGLTGWGPLLPVRKRWPMPPRCRPEEPVAAGLQTRNRWGRYIQTLGDR